MTTWNHVSIKSKYLKFIAQYKLFFIKYEYILYNCKLLVFFSLFGFFVLMAYQLF